MPLRSLAAALVCTLWLAGCGGVPSDVAAKMAAFQEQVETGRLEEIRQMPARSDWDKYLGQRAALGRIVSSAPMQVFDVDGGDVRVVTVRSNTEFERGRAMETFTLEKRRQDSGLRVSGYSYDVRKRVVCPAIRLSPGRCWIEDVASAASRQ